MQRNRQGNSARAEPPPSRVELKTAFAIVVILVDAQAGAGARAKAGEILRAGWLRGPLLSGNGVAFTNTALTTAKSDPLMLGLGIAVSSHNATAPSWQKSSIFLRRMIGSMFMRVNSKCAHQVRPPLSRMKRRLTVCRPSATREDLSRRVRYFVASGFRCVSSLIRAVASRPAPC